MEFNFNAGSLTRAITDIVIVPPVDILTESYRQLAISLLKRFADDTPSLQKNNNLENNNLENKLHEQIHERWRRII